MSALAEGDRTFSGKLSSISEGKMNYQEFLNILDEKLQYDPIAAVSTEEKPFVMLSYKKDYLFTPLSGESAVIVEMTDEGSAPRPMALLHLDRITSEAPAGETATDLDLTSKVFVLDVKLVNVPDGYYFNSGSAACSTSPTLSDIQIGSANADGYYTRTWPGTIHENVSGTMSKRDYTNGRIYRMVKNEGVNSWQFGDLTSAIKYDNPTDPKRYSANNGNITAFFSTLLPEQFENHLDYSESDLDGLTRGGAILSQTPWNINVDKTLYIPENISATSSSMATTGFVVRLALSNPELDLSAIPTSFWNSKVSSWTLVNYYTDEDIFSWEGKTSNEFLTSYSHTCWSDDATKVDVIPSANTGEYAFLIGNLSRLMTANIPNTTILAFDESPTPNPITSGVTLNWNIPTSGTKVVDVFVPINDNNPDIKPDDNNDYSVRRNQKYNVTLHVMKSTYDNLATRATDGSTIPVTVKATINKVSDNQ